MTNRIEDLKKFLDDRESAKGAAVSVKFIFAWHDLWIGMFVDVDKGKLYFFPMPCFGIVVTLRRGANHE